MIRLRNPISTLGVPLGVGLVLAGAGAVGMGHANPSDGATRTSGAIHCEVRVTPVDGAVQLEGIARADAAVSGTYSFRVVGSGGAGSSSIEQGGSFAASPNAPAVLGKVVIGSQGASYDVRLGLSAGHDSVECTRHVGSALQRTGPVTPMPRRPHASEAALASHASAIAQAQPPINDG